MYDDMEFLNEICNEKIFDPLNFLFKQYYNSENNELYTDDNKFNYIKEEKLSLEQNTLKNIQEEIYNILIKSQCNVLSSKYFGYITPRPLPITLIGDWLAMINNQTPGAWRAGPNATRIEWCVLNWIGEIIGYEFKQNNNLPKGIITSGGSYSNLTALHIARNRFIKQNNNSSGIFYVSEETHHSIYRSLELLGIKNNDIHIIKTLKNGEMDIENLKHTIKNDLYNNLKPSTIIATYGTTTTGAIDRLDLLNKIAKKYNLWLHVDGASGAVFANMDNFKLKYGSLNYADSVTFDPSKWMFTSYSIGTLFLKNMDYLYETYTQDPNYWDSNNEHDNFQISFNGTRPWRSLGIYLMLKLYGKNAYLNILENLKTNADYICKELVKRNYIVIRGSNLPIFLFSHENLNSYDKIKYLCNELIKNNIAYTTIAKFKNRYYIRVSINNYKTNKNVLDSVINGIENINDKVGRIYD